MTVDCLIIGQGLSGTFLSWNLLKAGQKVMVIDEARPSSATRVASGVINPVTGRRHVKTWMIDELLPFSRNTYEAFGDELGVTLVKQCDLLMFHPTTQMRDAFEDRYNSDKQYVAEESETVWQRYFHFQYGIGRVTPCFHVDLHLMIGRWREELMQQQLLVEERFDAGELSFDDAQVNYRNITAHKIVFCNGTDAFDLPYFRLLPHSRNKGEALIVEIPGLPSTHIYKHGLSITPWDDGLFWIGSTYQWEFQDLQPTEQFRKKAEAELRAWLKLPFRIVDHLASERPATLERRPFVGFHPVYPAIGILNGMGTKGCSLAPYFASQLTQQMVNGTPILAEADINRFRRILSER